MSRRIGFWELEAWRQVLLAPAPAAPRIAVLWARP
jgi:hypothetical protein